MLILNQPTDLPGAAGQLYIGGISGRPPTNQFYLQTTQTRPFVPTGWGAGALTGFSPVNPATAQLGYSAAGPVTTVQAEGDTVGALILGADWPEGSPNGKLMITPIIQLLGVNPFPAANSVLTSSMSLRIPTCDAGGAHEPVISTDLRFEGPGGMHLSYNVGLFRLGAKPAVGYTIDKGFTGDVEIDIPLLDANSEFVTRMPGTGMWGNTTFASSTPYSFMISSGQFGAALQFLSHEYPDLFTGSALAPSAWALVGSHLNAEFKFYAGQKPVLGWSMQGWQLTQFTSSS